MHCIYEVTVEVEQPIAQEYLLWLRAHIDDIQREAGFAKTELFTLADAPEGFCAWVTHYHASHREVIDSYLKNLAPRYRADGIKHFGNRFRAQRRILIFQS